MSVPDRLSGRNVGIGAAAGAVAYVAGYLVAYVTIRDDVQETLSGFSFLADLFGGDPIPAWQGVGWVFYNAHFVDTEVPSFGGTQMRNFIASSDGGLTFMYVVPPLFLLAAGFAAAYAVDTPTPTDGAAAGALTVAGYLPLALAGLLVFAYEVGDGAVAPDPVTGVLLAGIVFPAVLGAAGGAVASALGDD
ncbi:hypothetical protein JCM17823_25830 [Halorubrum gandharaense]